MIKVFIERQVPPEMISQYQALASEMMQMAMARSGFISGEVLHDIQDSQHRLVIATYRTTHDWLQWFNSAERHALMDRLGPMLEHEEKISIYEH